MIIIFDLDHTLINSEKFKNCLPGIFKLTKKRFLCEIDIYFKGKKDLYSPLKHAVLRYKNGKINKKSYVKTKNKLFYLAKSTNSYVYSDADRLLKKLRQKNNYLLLLSHGNCQWQRLKIKGLHIKGYFDRIIITDKKKTAALKFLKNKKEDILIVNDNSLENKEMLDFLGRGRAILIKSTHSYEIKHNYKLHSFKQATKVIMNNF